MRRLIERMCMAASALLIAGCITNNIPYPYIDPVIDMEVEGVAKENVKIDFDSHTVKIALPEEADICKVKVKKFVIPEPEDKKTVTVCDKQMEGAVFDLSNGKTVEFTLSNYPDCDYKWEMSATQAMERYFSVTDQVGASVIDALNHRILVYVTGQSKLSKVLIKSIKLDADGITAYSKNEGDILNMLNGSVAIEATTHGRTQTWDVYAEKLDKNVFWSNAAPWSRCIWLEASGLEGHDNGFCYRKRGDQDWITVDKALVEEQGGQFKVCIDALECSTEYECYAYCDDDKTDVRALTTESERQIPNGGFDVYSRSESSKYDSFFDPSYLPGNTDLGKKWWDNGNVGSTAVGESGVISAPDTAIKAPEPADNKASAHLTSKYVVVKFAAGNIFSGEFAGLVGTAGGKVNFGRPWIQRPRKLCFDIKANCGKINHRDGNAPGVNLGDPDTAEIFVCLGDWDYKKYGGTQENPVQVNTTVASTLFDPNGPDVIAYGCFSTQESFDWKSVEVEIDYRDVFRQPTHIILSAASSKWGDFFTGCDTNEIWLDNVRFEY